MGAKRNKKVWILPLAVFLIGAAFGLALAVGLNGEDPLLTQITVEAGEAIPDAAAFRKNMDRKLEVTYAQPEAVAAIDTNQVGSYPVELNYRKKTVPGVIQIRDTTPPRATTRDLAVFQMDPPKPEDFLVEVEDVSQVTADFQVYPNLTDPNPQTVTIVLTDAWGNTATATAGLTVEIDTQPPRILGLKDIVVYEGDTVSYRAGVTAVDDRDENPTLEIDTQGVDLSTPGEYTAAYTAVDESGNEAREEITVTVLARKAGYATLEEIDAVVDQVLSRIIEDGMSTRQQLRAIFDYIRGHSSYVNHSDKDDWRQAGYRLLVKHSGDCFNYFAAGKLLMEKLGIPNIDVVKVKNYPSDSDHFWSLVSTDGGETYYHFDMTPRTVPVEFFLVTDSVLDRFSENYRGAFNRDKSLYPATPEQ